ncbi:hypothetical protein GQX74_009424 [Glossina fuscipes]|nr:hypothetical protein GQX74_009424 [Glossina fuscipes]
MITRSNSLRLASTNRHQSADASTGAEKAKSLTNKVVMNKTQIAQKTKDGVNDIDEDDSENLLLASEYVNDIYDYLFQLEFEQPIVKNHLEGHVGVNVNMRPVLIDEINEVHLQFRLIPETFQMVVAIIERCLQAVTGTKRSQLQLVGVTGLFVAVKYEELFPPPIANFVYITHESYTDSQIRKMELKMIET